QGEKTACNWGEGCLARRRRHENFGVREQRNQLKEHRGGLTDPSTRCTIETMATSPIDPCISDEQLAKSIVRRDTSKGAMQEAHQAFTQLYERHAPKLLAFLAARAPRSDLEDFHQAIWARVWQHLPDSFKGDNFRAWLYKIAHNYLIDM